MTAIEIAFNDYIGYAKLKKFLEQPGENKGNYVTTGIKSSNTISTYLHKNGYNLHPRVTKQTTLLIVPNDPNYDSNNLRAAYKNPKCVIVKEYDIKNLFWAKEYIEKALLQIEN